MTENRKLNIKKSKVAAFVSVTQLDTFQIFPALFWLTKNRNIQPCWTISVQNVIFGQ